MEISTGFLLSGIKYGEQDAVLNCYTQQQGYQTFFVKNIYVKNNKKKPYLSPLNELCLKSNILQKSQSMKSITQIEVADILGVEGDVRATSIVFFISDFLNIVLRNEVYSEEIYAEILELRRQILAKNYQCHAIFMLRLLKIQGAMPYLSEGQFLNPEEGAFSEVFHSHMFGVEVSRLWREILVAQDAYSCQIPPSERRQFLDSIMLYYQYHIPNFKTPNSLDIIKQIFE